MSLRQKIAFAPLAHRLLYAKAFYLFRVAAAAVALALGVFLAARALDAH